MQGGDSSRRPSLGWLATAVFAAIAAVVGVDAWAAEATARGAEALSANALRSVELAEDMRWQLARLTHPPGGSEGLEPSTAQALLWLKRDVRAYEQLATFEGERPEWLTLSGLTRDLGEALARGDTATASQAAVGAFESAERLIALNRAEADAIGAQVVRLGRSQVLADALAGAVVLLAFAQVARARVRSLERERAAIAGALEAMEDKNRELEAFAGRVAHDLRSPLTPVQALAGLLGKGGQADAEVRRIAGRIASAASRMSDVIEAMLTFSRSGRLDPGECMARSVVAEVLEEMGPALEGAELRVDLPDARVACAPEVLGQIVRNLVGNALKFRSPDRSSRVEIAGTTGLRALTLTVSDNGVGMEPAVVRRAFEPGFRASFDRPGNGLGLAIVDRYVRALGGSVALSSRPGVGTRIDLRLPLGEAPEVRALPALEAAVPVAGLRRAR